MTPARVDAVEAPDGAGGRWHWRAWLAGAGFAACAAGFVLDRTWEVLPRELRLFEVLLIALLALAPAGLLRLWPKWRVAATLPALALLAVGFYGGWLPLLATLLLALAAIGLGSLVLPGPVSLVVGLAMLAGLVGWLLPLPVHTQWVHGLGLALIVALRARAIGAVLRAAARHAADAIDAAPLAATLAMLAMLLASAGCWLPTLQYDDVAYHLGLPFQLQATARYALDPDQQVWALAPWAGDVLQAIAQVVAGQESRGAVNALWLWVAATLVHALAGLSGARPWARWAAVSVFATVPMTIALASGMQTELPGTVAMLALAWLVWRGAGTPVRGATAGGLLFGLLCALKVMHAVTALPLLLWAAVRHRRSIGVATLAIAGGCAAAAGGASYAYAWIVTGNPVLPLLNGMFGSAYFRAENFADTRWTQGFSPDLPWRMTFDTGQFLEGYDGALGFLWIALSGAWLLAVLHRRTRGLALAGAAGLLLSILPIQYARYAYPSLVLVGIPAVSVLAGTLRKPLAAGLLLVLCLAQLAFFGSAYWMLGAGALRDAINAGGADAPLYEKYAPERELLRRMRAASSPPAGRVLAFSAEPDALAELGARGRTTAWYSHRLSQLRGRANRDPSGKRWAALVRREGVTDLVLRPGLLTPAQRQALVVLRAYRVDAVGDAEWWRLP